MNNLRILYWNCNNGIKEKLPELTHFVHKYHIDIVLLGEIRANPSTKIKINNFHTYRRTKPKANGKPSHGGTAILIKSNIIHYEKQLPTEIDSTSVVIRLGNQPLRITSVYKSHNIPLKNSDLNLLTNRKEAFLVAGDYNAKHTHWNSSKINTSGKTIYDPPTIITL